MLSQLFYRSISVSNVEPSLYIYSARKTETIVCITGFDVASRPQPVSV